MLWLCHQLQPSLAAPSPCPGSTERLIRVGEDGPAQPSSTVPSPLPSPDGWGRFSHTSGGACSWDMALTSLRFFTDSLWPSPIPHSLQKSILSPSLSPVWPCPGSVLPAQGVLLLGRGAFSRHLENPMAQDGMLWCHHSEGTGTGTHGHCPCWEVAQGHRSDYNN